MRQDSSHDHREPPSPTVPADPVPGAATDYGAMLRSHFAGSVERVRTTCKYTRLSPAELLLMMFVTERIGPEARAAFYAERLGIIGAGILALHYSLEEQAVLLEGYDRDAARALDGQ